MRRTATHRLPAVAMTALFVLALFAGLTPPATAQFTDDTFDGTIAGSVTTLTNPGTQCTSPGVPSGCYTWRYDNDPTMPMDKVSTQDYGYFIRPIHCNATGGSGNCVDNENRCVLYIDEFNKLVNTANKQICGALVAGSTFYDYMSTGTYNSGDGGISFGSVNTIDASGSSSLFRMGKDSSNNVVWLTFRSTSWKFYPGALAANLATYQPSDAGGGPILGIWSVGAGGSGDWVFARNSKITYTTDNFATGTEYSLPSPTCGAMTFSAGKLYCFFQYASASSVHATSNDLGVSMSTDFGATWSTAERLFVAPSGKSLTPAFADAQDGAVYLVGSHNIGSNTVFYAKTSNGGATWVVNDLTTSPAPAAILTGVVTRDGYLRMLYRTGTLVTSAAAQYLLAPVGVDPSTGDPDATADIANLVGFDVSPGGTQVVTREGIVGGQLGRNVRVYNGDDLTPSLTTPYDTGCNFSGVEGGYSGIASASIIDGVPGGPNQGTQVEAFLVCSSPNTVNGILMQVVSGGVFGNPVCDTAYCSQVALDEDLAGNDDKRREISDLQTYPYDWSESSTTGLNHAYLTWGFSTTDGDIGAVSLVQINQQSDTSDEVLANIDAAGTRPVYVCTARGSVDDADYIYGMALGTGGNVAGYQIVYNQENDWPHTLPKLNLALSLKIPGGQVSNPAAMGCGENKLLTVARTSGVGTVKLFTIGAGVQTVATGANIGTTDLGAALSPTANVGAYRDDDVLRAFRTDTLALFQNITLPDYGSATPCGMQVTREGAQQSVYFAACGVAGHIYRWTLTDSPFKNEVPNPSADTDNDGKLNSEDDDIDGDGIPNSQDPDIDGDFLCNSDVTEAQTADQANPGRGGCTPGDTDSDGDGLSDVNDPSPGGTATGPGAGSTPPSSTGGGLLGVTGTNALYITGAIILGLLAVGYRFTAGNRSRNGRDDSED